MHGIAGIRSVRLRLQRFHAAVRRTGRHILLSALLAACLSAGPALAQEQRDTPANRYLAAEAYLKIHPLDAMVNEITGEILKVMPQQYHEEFRRTMKESMDRINLEELTLNAIVKHFTVKEINALTEFYSSPEGQSIMKKMPVYTKEIMPAILGIIPEAVKSVEEKMRG